jgi:hypothetical protein
MSSLSCSASVCSISSCVCISCIWSFGFPTRTC